MLRCLFARYDYAPNGEDGAIEFVHEQYEPFAQEVHE